MLGGHRDRHHGRSNQRLSDLIALLENLADDERSHGDRSRTKTAGNQGQEFRKKKEGARDFFPHYFLYMHTKGSMGHNDERIQYANQRVEATDGVRGRMPQSPVKKEISHPRFQAVKNLTLQTTSSSNSFVFSRMMALWML